jgi:hypothetical protein
MMRLPDKAVWRFSMGNGMSCCPDFSPDGKLVAYTNEYQGSTSVVVEEYKPKPEDRASVRFSGREPRWSVKGRELYFRSGTALHSVEVIRQPALALGRQARLFEIGQRYQLGYRVAAFDVMPDDRQFLMTARVEPPPSPATLINIVLDWRSRPRTWGGSSPAK